MAPFVHVVVVAADKFSRIRGDLIVCAYALRMDPGGGGWEDLRRVKMGAALSWTAETAAAAAAPATAPATERGHVQPSFVFPLASSVDDKDE